MYAFVEKTIVEFQNENKKNGNPFIFITNKQTKDVEKIEREIKKINIAIIDIFFYECGLGGVQWKKCFAASLWTWYSTRILTETVRYS